MKFTKEIHLLAQLVLIGNELKLKANEDFCKNLKHMETYISEG